MGKCTTKSIQTNLGTFRHNQAYPGIIQAYLGIFRTLCYPDIFKTVVCSKPWDVQEGKYIQNPGIFTTLVHSEPRYIQNASIFKSDAYSEPCQHIRWSVNYFQGYNYFHKLWLFSQSLLRWSKYIEVVSLEVVMLCKKLWRAVGRGSWIFDILIGIFK